MNHHTTKKGTRVNPTTEHPAKTPSTKTGLFATLRGLLRARGSGAPSHRPAAPARPATAKAEQAHLLASVGPRRRTSLSLALALATAALLTLTAAPALASTAHVFSTSFGSAGSGDGQLSSPQGVAVNSTSHDVYVADTGNARVEQFSSSGAFIRTFGSFTTPTFVAVDNSGGLSAGDVYVGDTGTNLVQKFGPSGNLIAAWGSGGQLDGSTATGGPFTAIAGIAVDTSGNLFVYDPSAQNWFEFAQDDTPGTTVPFNRGTINSGIGVDTAAHFYKVVGAGNLEQYDTAGNDLGNVTGDMTGGSITGLAIDPTNNNVYADDGGTLIRHYDSSCNPSSASCTAVDTFGSGQLSGAAGTAVDSSSGMVFAADAGNARIDVFAPIVLPDVTTGPASNLTPNAATISGHLDPAGGGNITDCHFEYTDDASFQANGFSGAATAACAEGNSFSAPSDVHADLSGLSPETTYHYRLLASNANGANQGSAQTLTTPPAVTLSTGGATAVGPNSATLNANVDPAGNGNITDCHFQYIDDTTFQNNGGNYSSGATNIPCDQSTPISASTAATATPTNLTAATTYHFRIVATNAAGTTAGSDQTFATLPAVTLSTGGATAVGPNSATLNANVDPAGNGNITDCHFSYIDDTTFQNNGGNYSSGATNIPCDQSTPISASTAATATPTNLTAATTYHFRIVATNAAGTTAGSDQTFATPGPPAVDAESTANIAKTTATLQAQINPDGFDTTYHFDYVDDAHFQSGGFSNPATASTPESASIGSGFGDQGASTDLANLQPNTTYHYRAVATNSAAPSGVAGPDQTFTTNPSALIDATGASNVTATTATLNAQINPLGDAATYHFEYGTDTSYGHSVPTPDASAGSGSADQLASQDIAGLAPSTTYHFRVVATNSLGSVPGPDQTFKTEPANCPNAALRTGPSAHLPECRAYELVTPANKFDAQDLFAYGGTTDSVIPAVDGNRVALKSFSKLGPNPGSGAGASQGNGGGYVFSRGPSGWAMASVYPAAPGQTGYNAEIFSPDLTHVGVLTYPYTDFVNHGPDHSFEIGPPGGPYTTLATAAVNDTQTGEYTHDNIVGASSDFSHVVFSSTDHSLLPEAAGFAPGAPVLYEWTNGQLRLVNVNTDGSLISDCGARLGDGSAINGSREQNAVSADGSKIFFTDYCTGGVYMRLNGTTTVDLGAGGYQNATPDGSKVFVGGQEYDTNSNTWSGIPGTVSANGGIVDFSNAHWADGTIANIPPIAYKLESADLISLYTTPDDRFAAFASTDGRVYRYDNTTHVLTCVSCSPTDPSGSASFNVFTGPILDSSSTTPLFNPISADGRDVFFDSPAQLVPQDANQAQDVYEWHDGTISLISSGKDPINSGLVGASADGRDVFFITHAALAPQDTDSMGDIYDARIGGGFPASPPGSAPCEGDACQSPPAAPNDPTPSSSTFSGPGNPKAHFKRHHRKHHHKKSHRRRQRTHRATRRHG